MTENQWQNFCRFRQEYKTVCGQWSLQFSEMLKPLQTDAACKDTPPYPVETPVVYNIAFDEVCRQDEIKLIVIGDNPGKSEQLACNRRYLVGQAGKIAAGFFAKNPSFGIDFRKNVLILNKTPVHTAKTNHLRYLLKQGTSEILNLIQESQIWCAKATANLHQALTAEEKCGLWLVGYGELKPKGIFETYRETFKNAYADSAIWNEVLVFQHFSMNRFIIDLKSFSSQKSEKNAKENLYALGTFHRKEIFGC